MVTLALLIGVPVTGCAAELVRLTLIRMLSTAPDAETARQT